MKSRMKRCRVCAATGIKTQSENVIKTGWICKGCPGEPASVWIKIALKSSTPSLTKVSKKDAKCTDVYI